MRHGHLTVESQGRIVYATLHGDVDLSNAGELRDAIASATPNDALGVILNMTEVYYLDSAGLHLVHRLDEDLRARGKKLRLVVPEESVIHDVLRLAGLDWQGHLTQSVEAARGTLESNRVDELTSW